MDPTVVVFGIIGAIVIGVGVFAAIPKPAWLDRLWLWAIAAAFVLYVPIWLILKAKDHGWKAVATGVVGLFVAGVIRGLPSKSQE